MCKWVNGYIYEGSFVEGKSHCKGIMRFAGGDFFEGKIQGKGRLQFSGDAYYEGEWMNGMKNGEGEIKYSDGVIYNGGWKEDKGAGHSGELGAANPQSKENIFRISVSK
ncbi:MAG: hypothetical protein WCS03_03835 [Bacteroidota bacterium]